MKQPLVIAALVIAASALAAFHVAGQTYHPVVELASPDGFTYNVVQSADSRRNACGEANARFLGPVRKQCPGCTVVYARCERKLEGVELALSTGAPLPHYRVVGAGVQIAVQGPADRVRAACEEIALDVVHGGVPTAACVFPSPSPKF
jgi:hypothetical protein